MNAILKLHGVLNIVSAMGSDWGNGDDYGFGLPWLLDLTQWCILEGRLFSRWPCQSSR